MLPRRLTIQGLYSYQEKQTIDFTALTDAGIFGIFGSVGSGKSSILEAIGFALYGKTERLNDRENRNYNMMNLKSTELLIDFEFEHYNHTLYRFTVRGKRNSKRFHDVKTFDRGAYKLSGEEWIPLESTDATHILDLSYENFRRTVIVPQGKFQEFLQLGNAERTKMMMEIFHLHKYDLSANVVFLEKENDLTIAKLEGELKQLGTSTDEMLTEKKDALIQLQAQQKKLETDIVIKETTFNELTKLKEQYNLKTQYQKELQELEKDKELYIEKQKKLDTFQQAKLYFEPILIRKKDLKTSIKKRLETINSFLLQLEKLNVEIVVQTQRWNTVKNDYDLLDKWQIQILEFQNLHDAIQYQKQGKRLEEKILLTKSNIEKEEINKNKISQQLSALEERIRIKKAEQPSNIFVFNEVGEWFQQKNNFLLQIKDWHQQSATLQERIQKGKAAFQMLSFSYEQWQSESSDKRKIYNETLADLQQKKITLATKSGLQQYAINLQEGKPCPLCGAIHHPNLLTNEDEIAAETRRIEDAISQTNQLLAVLDNNNAKAIQYAASILSFEEQVDSFQTKITQTNQALFQHLSQFKWKDFDANSETAFLERKQQADRNLSEITQLEKDTSHLKIQLESVKDTLNQYKNDLAREQAQYNAALESAHNILNKLVVLTKESISQYIPNEILLKKKELENKVAFTKSQYEILQKEIQTLDKQKSVIESQIHSLQTEKSKESEEFQTISISLQKLLEDHQFYKESDIENVLNENIDIKEESMVIQQYQNRLFAAKQKLEQIKKILADNTFDESQWNALQHEIKTIKDSISENTTAVAQCKQVIQQLTEMLTTQKQVSKKLNEKKIRKENILTMRNLFSGSGFVNFISSVYLKNLCLSANDRFRKLTHNQLHLELGDNNEFLIRDVLNEGKTRSVKTLSGGQTFQASLCLALALADSVHYQNKSDQNFFFLDEGFGSLDKESLTTIYETLKSLRKENRIVGIISHVEDLQQEIPIFLLVSNNMEKGSQVQLLSN